MEQLLRTQQSEASAHRTELEQNLAQCQADLQRQRQQVEQVTEQLRQTQKVSAGHSQ